MANPSYPYTLSITPPSPFKLHRTLVLSSSNYFDISTFRHLSLLHSNISSILYILSLLYCQSITMHEVPISFSSTLCMCECLKYFGFFSTVFLSHSSVCIYRISIKASMILLYPIKKHIPTTANHHSAYLAISALPQLARNSSSSSYSVYPHSCLF